MNTFEYDITTFLYEAEARKRRIRSLGIALALLTLAATVATIGGLSVAARLAEMPLPGAF